MARDEAERRALVRGLARVGAGRLLLFCLVDDHLHAVVRAAQAGLLAEGLHRVLRCRRSDLKFKRPHLEPVETRAYVRNLIRYVLRQPESHNLGVESALWTGSCFLDLVGARLLPGFDSAALRSELPPLRMRELFTIVGLAAAPLRPSSDEAFARAGAARLVDLAASVHALGPTLNGRSNVVCNARALAALTTRHAGLPSQVVVRFLGVSQRTVQRLAERAVDPQALLALRLRLALEDRVRATATGRAAT